MKKKIIIFLLLMIVSTGCKVKYNITINEEGTVNETVLATRSADFFAEYKNSSVGRVVSLMLKPHLDTLNEKKYVVDNYITSSDSGVIVKKDYSNLKDYSNNTIFLSQYSDKINYSEDGDKVTISTTGVFSHSDQDQTKFPVSDAAISIKVPFKVTNHNADSVVDDTYTWIFDEKDNEERTITLTYDKSKVVGKNNFWPIVAIAILIIVAIVGFVVVNNIRKNRESVNEI